MNTNDPTSDSTAIPRVHTDCPEPAVIHCDPAPRAPHTTAHEDSPAHEAARQAAFDSVFEWHGQRLQPFSSSREALFAQHRLSMGAPDLQRCLDDLDAFFADAARILWLCSHTEADWGILRCSPPQLQAAIDRWTDEHIPGHESAAATMIGFRIYAASLKNQHTTVAPAGKGSPDLGN